VPTEYKFGKWSKWQQTMDLKFDTHPISPTLPPVLYQKWYRERKAHIGWDTEKQYQWRPIKGQTGATGILKGIEDEEADTCEPARDQAES
jgi:hypothetical protein